MIDQNTKDTAHLLRRATFGMDAATIHAAAQAGLSATTDALLHPERTPDTMDDDGLLARLSALLLLPKNGGIPTQAVRMWWAHRMVASPRPLVEKMTLFWHGHFTSKDGGMAGEQLYKQNQMFRQNALGSFRTLTLAVARDPEMMRYLNGNQNYKAHPNENFARELMELFTCGIGHYTEDDVKAAARAFSGWNLRSGAFAFNVNQHDNDPKTFLGKTGNWNGDDIVDILVAHPATANRLCTQLWTYFAYPDPEPEVLAALVKTYYSGGYDVRTVLDRIFRSRAFYSDKARFAIIKSPAQYVIGTVKMLGLDKAVELALADVTPTNDMAATRAAQAAPTGAGQSAPAPAVPTPAVPAPAGTPQLAAGRRIAILAGLPTAMRSMGQDLFAPPSVKGWDGGVAWINTSTLMSRISFANTISLSRVLFGGQTARLTNYVQLNNLTPEGWVDFLADALGPLPLTPATRQTLIEYVQGADAPAPAVRNVDFVPGPFVAPPPTAAPGTSGPYRRGMRANGRGYNRVQGQGYAGLEGRLRGVIPLIMATPEFQVC